MAKGFVNFFDLQQAWRDANNVKTTKQAAIQTELWFESFRDSLVRHKGDKKRERRMPASNATVTVELLGAKRVRLSVGSALHFA